MTADLAFLALDLSVIICAALIGARVLVSRAHLLTAQLVAVIGFNTICHVVLTRQEYSYWIAPPYRIELAPWIEVMCNLARNSTAAVFMLLCHTLFARERPMPRWLLALVALQLFLEAPADLIVPAASPLAPFILEIAPSLLQALFIGFALYWCILEWRTDLIEARRRARAFTSIVIGVNIVVSTLATRVLIDPNSIANYYAHVTLMGANLLISGFVLFRFSDGALDQYLDPTRVQPPKPTARVSPDAGALGRLAKVMQEDRLYLDPGLTLKTLADRVALPEYRLRKLIHEELGHQNFNAYLHSYRIKEACRQLRDPALRRTPILTIALSVGYQSVNTFNRGFREIMGVTPSAYRAGDEASAAAPGGEIGSPATE